MECGIYFDVDVHRKLLQERLVLEVCAFVNLDRKCLTVVIVIVVFCLFCACSAS